MKCLNCILTLPPEPCIEDCSTCDYHSPDLQEPCCSCHRWTDQKMDCGTSLEKWIKFQVQYYNQIISQGPLDKYTIDGSERLKKVFAIAQILSKRLLQNKTREAMNDPDLQEHITHYTTLYEKTLLYVTADNYDVMQNLLQDVHSTLHQLMLFFNQHYKLNYNLDPKPKTGQQKTPEEHLYAIRKTIERGGRPKRC